MPKSPKKRLDPATRDSLRKELGALKDARHVACQFFESDPLWPHGVTPTRREEIYADPVGWLAKFAIDLRSERGELIAERDNLRIAYSDLTARESAASAEDANALQAERAAHSETKDRLSDAQADVAENDARLRELTTRANHWEGVAISALRVKARDASPAAKDAPSLITETRCNGGVEWCGRLGQHHEHDDALRRGGDAEWNAAFLKRHEFIKNRPAGMSPEDAAREAWARFP